MKNLNAENHNQVGTLIKNGRLAKGGMTAQELADMAALSRAYIAKIEAGMRKAPSDEALGRIASALEIPEEELERAKKMDNLYDKMKELNKDLYSFEKYKQKFEGKTWPESLFVVNYESEDKAMTWSNVLDAFENNTRIYEIIEKLEKMDEGGLLYIKRQIEIYEETIAK